MKYSESNSINYDQSRNFIRKDSSNPRENRNKIEDENSSEKLSPFNSPNIQEINGMISSPTNLDLIPPLDFIANRQNLENNMELNLNNNLNIE